MEALFLVVGITMSLVSVRYFLDAPSHLAAAVAGAGLAIASALCFIAAAVVRLACDAPEPRAAADPDRHVEERLG